jgi:hypothetical protein
MNPRRFITLPAICLVACACAGSGAAAPQSSPGSITHLLQDIKHEIGDAARDADNQCHVIGIGAKPCGGPEGFLSWSSRDSDRDRLIASVVRHRDARQAENERRGILSVCRALPAPGGLQAPCAGRPPR